MVEKKMKKALVWIRNDFRFVDNPALSNAAQLADEVVLVYVYEGDDVRDLALGGASRWWLNEVLNDFSNEVKRRGGKLLIAKGRGDEVIPRLVEEMGVEAVFWNRRYEPDAVELDANLKTLLKAEGVEVASFYGNVLNEPHDVENKSGKPYQVFTPYWKACRGREVEICPEVKPNLSSEYNGLSIEKLGLLSGFVWWEGMTTRWQVSRERALEKLAEFGKAVKAYSKQRDTPSIEGTSKFSPWLHFGQLSVRELYVEYRELGIAVHEGYLRQLYWRDFAHQLMFHFPHSVRGALRKEFENFPWVSDDEVVKKWQKGQTGYPIIDAGMRELWQTGWMHNRVRMIVGSFLVKQLLQHWQCGLDWFWDTLVDADLANNTMGWQWCAGSGADAAPYFRIFNPVSQGEKFDPKGEYVRTYLPELAELPNKFIHKPWELEALELAGYGVKLGENYPEPIVELKEGREKALEAYQQMRAGASK